MSQANGLTSLKRIEFQFKGQYYRFKINPEEYSMDEPNRVTVTQTKGGAFIDDFGGGVKTISFKGTTGFKGTSKDPTRGYKEFIALRNMIRKYYTKGFAGTVLKEKDEMLFYNYTDKEYWVVSPKTFGLKRSIARPLLYLYEIELICIRPAGSAIPSSMDLIGGLKSVPLKK